MSDYSERQGKQCSEAGVRVLTPEAAHSDVEEGRKLGGSSSLFRQTEETSPRKLEKVREKVQETSRREGAGDGEDPNLVRDRIHVNE